MAKVVKVCHGHACRSSMSEFTLARAEAELAKIPDTQVQLETCPCRDNCKKGPTVVVENNGKTTTHSHVTAVEMGKLIKKL